MSDQRNLILAIVVSMGIIFAFQFFYELPRQREAQRLQEQTQTIPAQPAPTGAAGTAAPGTAATPGARAPGATEASGTLSRSEVLAEQPRIKLETGNLHGSLNLVGGRIDDVTLVRYRETVDPTSPEIVLLSPAGAKDTYFGEFGWVPADKDTVVPDAKTTWNAAQGEVLRANGSVGMTWDNGQGLAFANTYALDDYFMFTVKRSVTNTSDKPVTLHPYGLVSRWGTPPTMGYYILHEGAIGVVEDKLQEIKYSAMVSTPELQFQSTGGWLGFTDKYWLASVIPDQTEALSASFRHSVHDGQDRYQVDFTGNAMTVQPGATIEITSRMFAGAKELERLDHYAAEYNIPLFDRAVDFGWFYFLTKPLFRLLDFLNRHIGNYGLAIMALTLIVKLVLFPLANKSYKSMSHMKQLQPEMQKLRERFPDDRQKMNEELMALYKREKVNPMAGCLPIVVQIPVFFALYKVLFVSIEMRHAPFFGWIRDLSVPDPTSLFNLFGLLPFTPPTALHVGVLPIIMGITMFLQQKLNPQPADPVQAKVMMFLPLIFTFMFGTFPAGLVLYWTWNNLLSIAQQWFIMWRMGVKIG